MPFFLARISILLWFKVSRERFENIRNRCHTPIGLHTQTKPNPRYFRQYRNPGKDASGKNGTYDHPNVLTFVFSIYTKSVIGVCIFALFLSSSASVSNRLMVIICSRPPVCAALALIGACSLASRTKMSERAWRSRETLQRLRLLRSPSSWALIALVALFVVMSQCFLNWWFL